VIRFAVFVLSIAFVGCAHGPHPESRAAAPDDDRAVLVVLDRSSFCDPCRDLDAALADARIAPALGRVRVVRYAVDSFSGSEAFERLLGPRSPLEPPLLLGVVDDHVVRATSGVPSSLVTLRAFLDDVASLGGNGLEYVAVAAGADATPDVLLRAARWYDARQNSEVALALWRRLAARDDAPADARAQADWSVARAERKGEPWRPRAALDFAARHPATMFGWHALLYAAGSSKVMRAEVAELLRRDYEVTAPGRRPDVVYVALAALDLDVARELAGSLVRDGHAATASELMAIAEVEYASGHRDRAVALAERALAATPAAMSVRESLERYRGNKREVSPFVRLLVLGSLNEHLRGWVWSGSLD
jgi:hypothetical protein